MKVDILRPTTNAWTHRHSHLTAHGWGVFGARFHLELLNGERDQLKMINWLRKKGKLSKQMAELLFM